MFAANRESIPGVHLLRLADRAGHASINRHGLLRLPKKQEDRPTEGPFDSNLQAIDRSRRRHAEVYGGFWRDAEHRKMVRRGNRISKPLPAYYR